MSDLQTFPTVLLSMRLDVYQVCVRNATLKRHISNWMHSIKREMLALNLQVKLHVEQVRQSQLYSCVK